MMGVADTESQTPQEREQRLAFARTLCDRWHCGSRPDGPLPPDLEAAQASAAEVLRIAPSGRCYLSGAYHPDDGGWTREVFDALACAGGERLPTAEEMGRPLTAVDRDGVLEVLRARGRMRALQDAQWRRERERPRE